MKSLWYQCNSVRSERNHCGINVTVSGQTEIIVVSTVSVKREIIVVSMYHNGVRSDLRNHCGINVTVSDQREIIVVSM